MPYHKDKRKPKAKPKPKKGSPLDKYKRGK